MTGSETPAMRAFEPWMLTNLATGAVMGAFVVLLIPPFITQQTGSPARAGVVFAVMALAGLTGPWFGRIADRYGAHRAVYTLSFVGLTLSFVVLALDGTGDVYSPIAGVLLGASLSAKAAVGTGLLVGSGAPEPVQARQLTVSNLLIFGGQILGGLLVAGLHLGSISFVGQFWCAAALVAAGGVLAAVTTGAPARRVRTAARPAGVARVPTDAVDDPEPASHADVAASARPSFRQIIASPFGALMGAIALASLCMAVLSSQVANILPTVFSISQAGVSGLVAFSGLLGIVAVVASGPWLARSGPAPALTASFVLRGAGFVGLALAGLFAGGPVAAILAAMLYLGIAVSGSLQRSPLPRAAVLLTRVGASEANGLVSAAGAFGAFIGCLAAGFVADAASYEAVLWMSAIAAVAPFALLPILRHSIRAARAAR